LDLPSGAVDVCGNALVSTPQGAHHHTEIKIFGLAGAVRETWMRIYTQP
jgi:hypothetical protein